MAPENRHRPGRQETQTLEQSGYDPQTDKDGNIRMKRLISDRSIAASKRWVNEASCVVRSTCLSSLSFGLLAACGFTIAGCQAFSQDPGSRGLVGRPPIGGGPASTDDPPPPEPPKSLAETTQQATSRVMNFVTGREQQDRSRGKQLYQQGDRAFRQAKSQPRSEAIKSFKAAAKLFRKAGEAAPGSALEQDALFMQAESLFFADRLTDAAEVYQQLQKDYPRSRHTDRVASRLFSISGYWIETVKASDSKLPTLNLTDPKRPRTDVDGHAVRVLDQIRYDDPTGRLADDATMAAAAEFIRQQKFDRADEFLTDLRETFSDSEHLFLAHLLGIRCKLEVYAGAEYSGLVLEEAEKLVKQTRQRFPDRLQEEKYADIVARAAAEIAFLRAERLAYRAEYREKRREYGAARYYYQKLLEAHPDTPHAAVARKRLAAIEEFPAVPTRQLAWLTKIFPDSETAEPLETTFPGEGDSSPDGTMLR